MLAWEVWDVAPSCWKYPIQSSSSSSWFTKMLKISMYAAVVMVASKKMGPIMCCQDIPDQTPIFSEWRGSSCITLGFSLVLIWEFWELCRHPRPIDREISREARQAGNRLAGGPLLHVATIRCTTDTFLLISHTTNVLPFKFRCNIFIGVRIIKEMSGSVASGTHCIISCSLLEN